MSDIIWWAVYIGGFVFTYRHAYTAIHEQWADDFDDIDGMDQALFALLGVVAGFMWPVVLGGWAVWRTLSPVPPSVRKAELDRREAEIKRMERELGIRD